MAIVQADGMKHFDGQQNVMPEPNTNLMAPRIADSDPDGSNRRANEPCLSAPPFRH